MQFLNDLRLVAADVSHNPVRADTRVATKVDNNDATIAAQRLVYGSQCLPRIFKVMVGVGDKGKVDGVSRQPDSNGRVDDARHIHQALFAAGTQDIVDKGAGDIDGIDCAARFDGGCKQAGKQAGAGADIGDSHAGTDLAGSDDGMALVVDFTTAALEGADPLLPVRIDEVTVDARADALFLCGCRK